ncbi:MAG: hypothetical protein M0C28_31700 [Candidatus Moduliflexus flocculans]|nr:hypothetical protein [Candidatus Moduliflexus flocculans]
MILQFEQEISSLEEQLRGSGADQAGGAKIRSDENGHVHLFHHRRA